MNLTEERVLQTSDVHLISKDQAWHYRILPKGKLVDKIEFYCMDNVQVDDLASELEIILGSPILLNPIAPEQINQLLYKYYLKDNSAQNNLKLYTNNNPNEFLNHVIQEARDLKSSDIHIESYEHKCRVRIRIDGVMVERHLLKPADYPALINKIKIYGNLDIAEKRLPQDGRINFKYNHQQIDIRVSVLPTLHGEKVVLRLLNSDAANIDLNNLGFSAFDLDNYLWGAKRPNGILLISGPTGSGKTTTLYATLKLLNKETRNILTIEDPIEYTLEGINQVQLKESIGLSFTVALKTFLRQDPDVIMVGEIRDAETANMAIRAALTGHLVLSTIHTNSAWGTISRLIDMGIPSFLLASTITTTVAQRLVRLLCPDCKLKEKFRKQLYPKQFHPYYPVDIHYIAGGCEKCYFTGYRGRRAIYEVIPIDHELSNEMKKGSMYIDELLKDRGIRSLPENAFELFSQGLTSIDEIYPLLINF